MFKYAIIELLRRKRRTIATISGYMVAIIIFSVILNSLFESKKASGSILSGTGTHFIAYLPLCTNETCERITIDNDNEGFYADTIKTRLFSYSIIDLIKQFDTVRDASPFLLYKIRLKINDHVDSFMLGGIPLDNSVSSRTNSCSAANIVDGRFLTNGDDTSIMLEEGFAKRYYLTVGSIININNKDFKIAGIVNSGIRPVKADIYMPINRAREVINPRLLSPMDNQFNIILVEALNSKIHKETMFQVKSALGASGIISTYNCYNPASSVLNINEKSLILISIIIFIGILGFSLRSQYTSIIEKRYQIGILKVIGWTKKDILMELFNESIIQSLVGWLIGSFISLLINIFISLFYYKELNIIFYFIIMLYGLIFAVTGGIIAGLIPGFTASKIKISECLRRL